MVECRWQVDFMSMRDVIEGNKLQINDSLTDTTRHTRIIFVLLPETGVSANWTTVRTSTMDTASFNTLSPNTSIFSVGSTSIAPKMANVATGSTALMSEPKVKASRSVSGDDTPATPRRYSASAITTALMIVPNTAKTVILPMFRKKFPYKT